MGKTIIEKILAVHSEKETVKPGDITDVKIDVRLARDFGGANVVKNLKDNNLAIEDISKTFFTFDCNPSGSDQNYAANQQICRTFARDFDIPVFDINCGIGTHLAIDKGLAVPGSTVVSTDSHANILGAIGAFGQGMGDITVVTGIIHGGVHEAVDEHGARFLVHFVLHRVAVGGDFDDHIDLVGDVVTGGDTVQIHCSVFSCVINFPLFSKPF